MAALGATVLQALAAQPLTQAEMACHTENAYFASRAIALVGTPQILRINIADTVMFF